MNHFVKYEPILFSEGDWWYIVHAEHFLEKNIKNKIEYFFVAFSDFKEGDLLRIGKGMGAILLDQHCWPTFQLKRPNRNI